MSGPFGVAAQDYYDAGWMPIPMPPKAKFPPIDDFTGAKGEFTDQSHINYWLSSRGKASAGKMFWKPAQGNIALRLPPTVLGIDVDMYDGKTGAETFRKAQEQWGSLPPTYYASSRTDGSGIRLYRIPEGFTWPGKLPQGGGVELIRWYHRYVMCAPSIHDKTGEEYLWYDGDGVVMVGEIPDIDLLPELPARWVEELTAGKRYIERESVDMADEDVRAWVAARNGGNPCSAMARTLTGALRHVRAAGDDGGAHDAARDGAWALIGDAHAGHAGLDKALRKLREAFFVAVRDRRGDRLAREEWARIVIRGVQKVAAEGKSDTEDVCTVLGRTSSWGGSDEEVRGDRARLKLWDFERNDKGNAQRLVFARRHDMRFCDALGGWMVWNGRRWQLDSDGQMVRWAQDVQEDMRSEAQEIEDLKEKTSFTKWVTNTGNLTRITAMVNQAAKQKDISVGPGYFDGNPLRLGVENGTCELGDVVERKPAVQEHRITMLAGTAYDPDATSELWDLFLKRSQPDRDVLVWLQKLVGYSLAGGNDKRLFVVCFGPTSTGKTTFAEAIRVALGDYAGTMTMSVMRDNQDERARADLVEALPKRFLYMEEASHEWRLHADQIKRITGGTLIRARLPHSKTYVESLPQFTPWLFTNSAPHIEGADKALERRLVVVPFDQKIEEAEELADYRTRLMSENVRPAVLAWCLRGWEMYRADRDLSTPPSCYALRDRFLGELSDFGSMLDRFCEFGDSYREKPNVLFQAYLRSCEMDGVRSGDRMNFIQFGRALENAGYRKTSVRLEGKPLKVRAGLRLNKEFSGVIPDSLRDL